MEDLIEIIQTSNDKLSKKQQKKLKPLVLARLNEKLLDITDQDIESQLIFLVNELKDISTGSLEDTKPYKQGFQKLKKAVRKKYDFVETGALQAEYTAMGSALGVAFGAAFTPIHVGLIGVGIPIGVAMGAAIGKQKEDEAAKNGKLY